MVEIAIRFPNSTVCEWLGAETFTGRGQEGARVERGAVLGTFHGWSSELDGYFDEQVISPVNGVISFIRSAHRLDTGEVLVRIKSDYQLSGDRHQLGADIFQFLHQHYADWLRKRTGKINDDKKGMLFGGTTVVILSSLISIGLIEEGGINILGVLLWWGFLTAGFYAIKRDIAKAEQLLSRAPSESTLKNAWASAVSTHFA